MQIYFHFIQHFHENAFELNLGKILRINFNDFLINELICNIKRQTFYKRAQTVSSHSLGCFVVLSPQRVDFCISTWGLILAPRNIFSICPEAKLHFISPFSHTAPRRGKAGCPNRSHSPFHCENAIKESPGIINQDFLNINSNE